MERLVIGLMVIGLVGGVCGCEKKKEKAKKQKKEKKTKEKKEEKKAKAVKPDASKPATVGLVTVESKKTVDAVAKEMTKRIEKGRSVSLVADVDHAENAKSAEIEIPPTRLLVFKNPDLETPLVNSALTAGMDLPQKVLIWKGADGTTNVTFNAPAYVAKRHGVEKLDLFLGRMENGLASLVKNSSGTEVPRIPKKEDIGVKKGQGVITRESNNGVSETYEKLVKYVEETDELSLMAKVDHTENAKSVGRELRPAKLVIFGNPKMGTPLMQKSRTTALDLPQKMFIYETKQGDILITFNAPKYLAKRHGFDPEMEVVKKMDAALKKVAAKAAKEGE